MVGFERKKERKKEILKKKNLWYPILNWKPNPGQELILKANVETVSHSNALLISRANSKPFIKEGVPTLCPH